MYQASAFTLLRILSNINEESQSIMVWLRAKLKLLTVGKVVLLTVSLWVVDGRSESYDF